MLIIDSAVGFYNNNSTVINTVLVTTVVIVGVKVIYDHTTKTVVFDNNTLIGLGKMTEEAITQKDAGNLRKFLYELTMKGFKVGVTKRNDTAEAVVTALHRVCVFIEMENEGLKVDSERFQNALDLIAELADKAQALKTAKKLYNPMTWFKKVG